MALALLANFICNGVAKRSRINRFFAKRKKQKHKNVFLLFWRRREDSNFRAGYPTYTLSRGASSANLSTSPFQKHALFVLEQHTNRRFLVCHIIILDFFWFVKPFFILLYAKMKESRFLTLYRLLCTKFLINFNFFKQIAQKLLKVIL